MSRTLLLYAVAVLLAVSFIPAQAKPLARVRSPAPGVLCDRYICANDKGISRELTEKYLGKKAAAKTFTWPDINLTEFTFANGIFCDVKERLCRENRYYDANGQRAGAVSRKYTTLLFGD